MTLSLELGPEQEIALRARAAARGGSVEEYAGQFLARDLERGEDEDASGLPRDSRPVWEVIADIMKDVPAEDLAALPKDGASQIDHYVYGVPKRDV